MPNLASLRPPQLLGKSSVVPAKPKTIQQPQTVRDFRVGSSIIYTAATTDLGSTYPEVPMGGSLADILGFAQARNLPAFRLSCLPPESALIVYCWLSIPLVPMPLAFVYIDSSIRDATPGFADLLVYRFLINMPVQLTPLTLHGSETDQLNLLSTPDCLWTPFIPPAPYWPVGSALDPNPYLLFQRGGIVPVDASGLSDFIAAFV